MKQHKQVRDILHINDLFQLIKIQIQKIDDLNGEVFNVGGGRDVSISLQELTRICKDITGNHLEIKKVVEDRVADIRIYLTDNTKINSKTGWKPEISPQLIMEEIIQWIMDNKEPLRHIFG